MIQDAVPETPHIPVMLNAVLAAIAPQDGETYLDATFGAGGYSKAILDSADCHVIALDRDPNVRRTAGKMAEDYAGRFTFYPGCFGDALELLPDGQKLDGFVMDIGVSSMQIDTPERGFSFLKDGPLDMRMDPDSGGETAADVVNSYDSRDLAYIFKSYGDEKHAGRVARGIAERREESQFTTTLSLSSFIAELIPQNPRKPEKIHPATRCFQALRIHVNQELQQLEDALMAAEKLLNKGGRLVVVSFHSLEDRIVKNFMRDRAETSGNMSRHLPEDPASGIPPSFTLPQKKAVFPTETEAAQNPRARSARLRLALRTEHPPRATSSSSSPQHKSPPKHKGGRR